jgi:hypothetical protein
MLKKCIGPCGLEKEENKENFSWRKDTLKFRNECRICSKIRYSKSDKKYKENNKEKLREKSKINARKRRKNHPDKVKESNRKYRKNNAEKVKKARKKRWDVYYKENSEIIQEKNKNYQKNNKEKINKKRNNRRKNDPIFRLKSLVSCFVRQSLKKNKSSKNNASSLSHINIEDLKFHLEKQFEPWMNWSNQGNYDSKNWNDLDKSTWKWQLDHIIPQSDLPYTSMEDENFKKCWALENLRPYPAKYNVQEKNRKNKLIINNIIISDWEYINEPNSHYRYNYLNKQDYIKLHNDNNYWTPAFFGELKFLEKIINIKSKCLDELKLIIDKIII